MHMIVPVFVKNMRLPAQRLTGVNSNPEPSVFSELRFDRKAVDLSSCFYDSQ